VNKIAALVVAAFLGLSVLAVETPAGRSQASSSCGVARMVGD